MLLSPEVDEEQATTVVDRVSHFITERGGSVTSQEHWGVRKLAYPIQGFQAANYMLTQFTSEPTLAGELEASLTTSEEVIRHLLVKKAT